MAASYFLVKKVQRNTRDLDNIDKDYNGARVEVFDIKDLWGLDYPDSISLYWPRRDSIKTSHNQSGSCRRHGRCRTLIQSACQSRSRAPEIFLTRTMVLKLVLVAQKSHFPSQHCSPPRTSAAHPFHSSVDFPDDFSATSANFDTRLGGVL